MVPSPKRSLPWIMGFLAFAAVVGTINGPGITLDERLDVAPGRKYVQTLQKTGWGFFAKVTVDRVYEDNAEHPPLGRWLLGTASTLGQPIELMLAGKDPLDTYIRSARLAPAACFGILVGLIAGATRRRYGTPGGAVAGFSLIIMPRVFAHAHLGALDTFVALFWTLALLRVADAVESRRPVLAMALAGIFWGLALLTKIHGWLLPPVVLAYGLARLPIRKAILALMAWGLVGIVVFVAGWPWLWYDSIPRFIAYFRTGTVRIPIRVLYFGTIYLDRDVPWHYPTLYFLTTVPIGLHILGGVGLLRGFRDRPRDPFPILWGGVILGFLTLFATKVPVYDGERLFLPAFPAWAILIGRGFAWFWDDLAYRPRLRASLVAAVLAQSLGLILIWPFGLSYYSGMVGGLPGAERLGLELNYWGDAVDDTLVDQLAHEAPAGSTAAVVPTPSPDHGKVLTNRTLLARSIILGDEQDAKTAAWVIVWRREAYWPDEIRRLVATDPPVATRSRQGVWLSGIWKVPRRRMP